MPLVVPNEGERRLLSYIVNKAAPTNLVLHLYTNSIDLSGENWAAGNLNEANGAGYAAVTLAGSTWTISTTAGVTAAVYDSTVAFTFSVAQNVQGYYVTDTSGNILWAEEFPGAPFSLPSTGGEITIRPQVQLN